MRNYCMLMTGLAAFVILSPIGVVRASEGTGKEAGETGHAATKETFQIPDKLPDLWYVVLEKQTKLDQVIAAKQLDKVHVVAFQIRDLVQAMPGKTQSQGLSAENQKKLGESVGRVGDVAKLLDQYGDAGDEAKTKDQAARLGTLLKYIESLYPKGTLGDKRPTAALYTCPMHPEVRSDRPGSCPKCGMALEPGSPHGGAIVGSAAGNRLELVSTRGALALYVLDAANRALPIDKMKVSAEMVVAGKEGTDVLLAMAGDHWSGMLAIPKGGSVVLEVKVSSGEKSIQGHFAISESGAAVWEGKGEGAEKETGESEHSGHSGH